MSNSKNWWETLSRLIKKDWRVQVAAGLGVVLLLGVFLVPALTRYRMGPLAKPGSSRNVAVLGYYENGGPTPEWPSSHPSMLAHHNLMDSLSPFWYTVMADGSLKERSPKPDVLEFAHKNGLKVYPLVNNDRSGGDNAAALRSEATRSKAVASIVDMVRNSSYDGVHVDFQLLPTNSRDQFTAFVTELRSKLPRNKQLSVAVFPKVDIDPSISGAYDYAALAKKVEFMVMMAYDRHYEGGTPGAVSPNNWVEANIKEFLRTGVPANKLVLAVGTYGYDWPEAATGAGVAGGSSPAGTGKVLPTKLALDLVKAQRANMAGDTTGNPYFRYQDQGQSRVVYFQDAHMLAARLGLVRRYKLKGIAIWRLGYEEPAFWSTLEKELGTAKKTK